MQYLARAALLPEPAANQPAASSSGGGDIGHVQQRQPAGSAVGRAPVTLVAAAAVVALAVFGSSAAAQAALPPPPPDSLAPLDAAAHHLSPLADLAEGEEFWSNVGRYARYFLTVMLGTGYAMTRPIVALFKRPVTALLAVVGIAGTVYFVKFTLDAMLGISEPVSYDYF